MNIPDHELPIGAPWGWKIETVRERAALMAVASAGVPLSARQVAVVVDMSEWTVRNIERGALAKLREGLAGDPFIERMLT